MNSIHLMGIVNFIIIKWASFLCSDFILNHTLPEINFATYALFLFMPVYPFLFKYAFPFF